MGTPSLWQEQHPGRPFPALDADHVADVCVIGAGVTGASCAWRLLEQGLGVTVVDGRRAASAASGRNGGFAVAGTGLDHDELAGRLGERVARDLQAATERSLDAMIALAAELGVPGAVRRTGALWVARDDHEAAEIERELAAAAAAGAPGRRADELIPAPMRDRCRIAALFPGDAELLPAAWVRTLAAAAADRGAALFERSPVTRIESDGEGWAVLAGAGTVRAQAVVVACDGLIPRLLPQLKGIVYPVRGQVLATTPLADVPLTHPTHSQSGFMYYRPTPDGRVVVGGGRLEHLHHEYTDEEAVTAGVQRQLDAFLSGWLGVDPALVTHRWAGIIGFSADLLPVVGAMPGSPGLYVAGGYSGVGNVLGHLCGGIAADLIATGTHPRAAALDVGRFHPGAPVEQLEKRRSRGTRSACRRPGRKRFVKPAAAGEEDGLPPVLAFTIARSGPFRRGKARFGVSCLRGPSQRQRAGLVPGVRTGQEQRHVGQRVALEAVGQPLHLVDRARQPAGEQDRPPGADRQQPGHHAEQHRREHGRQAQRQHEQRPQP